MCEYCDCETKYGYGRWIWPNNTRGVFGGPDKMTHVDASAMIAATQMCIRKGRKNYYLGTTITGANEKDPDGDFIESRIEKQIFYCPFCGSKLGK